MNRMLKWLAAASYSILLIPAIALPSFASPDEAASGDDVTSKTDVTSEGDAISIQIQTSSAVTGDILEKVRKSLKESGVSKKAADQVMQQLESQLDAANIPTQMVETDGEDNVSERDKGKDKENKKPDANDKKAEKPQATVKVFGEALYIDKDGKKHRLELMPQTIPGAPGMPRDVEQNVKKMMQQLQKQMETRTGNTIPLNELLEPREAVNAPEFAIGVALAPSSEKPDSIEEGIVIESVFDDTPASAAGLEPGDKLVAIDQKELTDVSQVREMVQEAGKADREMKFSWERDGKRMDAKIKPQRVPATPELDGLGMSGGPGVQLSLPRIFVTPGVEGAVENGGIDQGAVRKELRELKKQLSTVQNELREIKEMLTKQHEAKQ